MEENQRTLLQELDPRHDLVKEDELNQIRYAENPKVAAIIYSTVRNTKHVIRGMALGCILAIAYYNITGEDSMTKSIITSAIIADIVQYLAREVLKQTQR